MAIRYKDKKLLDMYNRHFDIIKNIAFLFVEKLVFIALIFYSEAIISRALGVQDYGKWLYSVNLVILVSSLALVVGSEVTVPALSRHHKLQWHVLTSSFLVRFVFSCLAFLIINTYNYLFVDDSVISQMVTSLSFVLLLTEPFGVIVNYYQARIAIGYVVLSRVFALVVRALTITFALWFSYKGLVYFSRAIEAIMLASLLSILIIKDGGNWVFSEKITKAVLFRGLKLWLPLVLMYVYMRSDRIFVERYLGFDDLAMYGVAIQIFEQLGLLIGIIIQSIGPKFIFKKVARPKWKIFSFILVITVCAQTVSAILLPPFIGYIYGDNFNKAASMATYMLPALIFYSLDVVYMQYIYRDKLYKLLLVKWLLMLIFGFSSYYIWFTILGATSIVNIFNFNYFIMFLITMLLYRYYNKQRINNIIETV
ncbi:hypothetical protein [Aeromonas veronii]|uniref:hypothetical protein n=1 Tax=Aeromonas TaxID=642 RepID=UPI0021E6D7A2|nr:hypothetical protein [Aeromonas veronii]MCV3285907.1 hypothetical protein [Aeromonas veronii]